MQDEDVGKNTTYQEPNEIKYSPYVCVVGFEG